jgi:hypothetical protein
MVRLAKQLGVPLRQSYRRVGKWALIQYQRYAHAKQFKRARKPLRTLKTYLRRVIRDIGRKVEGDETLTALFAPPLSRAWRRREGRHHLVEFAERIPRGYETGERITGEAFAGSWELSARWNHEKDMRSCSSRTPSPRRSSLSSS